MIRYLYQNRSNPIIIVDDTTNVITHIPDVFMYLYTIDTYKFILLIFLCVLIIVFIFLKKCRVLMKAHDSLPVENKKLRKLLKGIHMLIPIWVVGFICYIINVFVYVTFYKLI